MLLFGTSVIVQAEEPNVTIGPQIGISRDAGIQQYPSTAYDSINERFLVAWTDQRNDLGQPYYVEGDIYGQLVNADGTLYGDFIVISAPNGSWQATPKVAFDPINERFLVVWGDNRDKKDYWDYGPSNTYGQFINADGSLHGGNFAITSLGGNCYRALLPSNVVFDSVRERFLIIMGGNMECGFYVPNNIYGKFVDMDGLLSGSLFPITSYTEGYGVWGHALSYDSNMGRFFVAYGLNEDKQIHGQLLNNDGTLYNENFTISTTLGPYDRANAIESISFDSLNNRFLVTWDTAYHDFNIRGQLINADGTLFGNEIIISADYPSDGGWTIFDTTQNKFLVVGYGGSSFPIFGQLLNSDGSLFDLPFIISSDIRKLTADIVFGSGETGSFVTWTGGYNDDFIDDDILGSFVRLKSVVQPPIANAGGPYQDNEGSLITFDAGESTDPDGDALQYRWDFDNDGNWDTELSSSPSAGKTWGDDWSGAAKLEVSDGELIATDSALVTINNTPATVFGLTAKGAIRPDQKIWAGDTLNFSGSFKDPGWLDTHTASWNYGDNTTTTGIVTEENNPPDATGTVVGSHIYYNKGTYVAALTVKDDDGGIGADSLSIDVQPIPAAINCDPNTLNLKSNGQWITCYIELPESYDVWQIDGSTIYLNKAPAYLGKEGWATAKSNESNIKDYDNDGTLERMVKFDREAIQKILKEGEQTLTLTGKVLYNSGLSNFEGINLFKATDKK